MWRFREYVESRDKSFSELWQRSAGLLGSKQAKLAPPSAQPAATAPAQQKNWLTPVPQHTGGHLTLYRGIGGDFDPHYYSAQQAWSMDLETAYEYALKNANAQDTLPTVVKTTLPGHLLDPNRIGIPTDKAVMHASGTAIVDIPPPVLQKLKVEVIPQQELDHKFPYNAKWAYQLRQAAHRAAHGMDPNAEEDWMISVDD
jgi:hypothetical protein